MTLPAGTLPIDALKAAFGGALQLRAPLAGYTTAHTGGPADALLIANSAAELEQMAGKCWELGAPFQVLGFGSNVLISDDGLRSVVIVNRARDIQINKAEGTILAESGALIGTIARQAGLNGLSGFEWAATVPGTLGGAIYGNAGAHGGDMYASLRLAAILHPHGKEDWPVERLAYVYRASLLKREHIPGVILYGIIHVEPGDPRAIQEKMDGFSAHRRRTQPPGASLGSMFKNPPGDYAGRLIEAAGLKGTRVGDAEISAIHANFFINHGKATAADIGTLIRRAREIVAEKFGVRLELEVELLGDWSPVLANDVANNGVASDEGKEG
jgi:UDP-N-acetylmuramate dehydrogenase